MSSKLNDNQVVKAIQNLTTSKTIGDFITTSLEEFTRLNPIDRIGFFFSSPTGPTILSSIFNNTTNLQEPSDSRLLYRKESWVNIRFATYLYNTLSKRSSVVSFLNRLAELYRRMGEDEKKIEEITRLETFVDNVAYNEVGTLALKSLFKFRDTHRQEIKEDFKALREKGKILEFSEARAL